MPLASGSRVGPFAVAAQIGVGGMGEVYRATDTKLGRDVALKVLPDLFIADPDRLARFEREAKVLASLTTESGPPGIYVRPFPDVDAGSWQVSTGRAPVWAASGEELFYLGPDGWLMGVPVERGATTFSFGAPTRLFEAPYLSSVPGLPYRTYDVAPDGQRFLMIKERPGSIPACITVVVNWPEELKARVPTN